MTEVQSLRERRYAARLGLLLALALVVAQSGAVVHGYSHLNAPSAPARSGQVCGDCLLFSPLLSAAGGTIHSFVLARTQTGPSYRPPVAPLAGQPTQHAFLARAPPSLA
jgi:hypothetical protein